ncbi:MAG TPA: hypothetical protein VKU38_12100, partial [Ktedonobacteraceae bacterium]|nr:hypothetical protein [Ktedonobacteraceae bacterium]
MNNHWQVFGKRRDQFVESDFLRSRSLSERVERFGQPMGARREASSRPVSETFVSHREKGAGGYRLKT